MKAVPEKTAPAEQWLHWSRERLAVYAGEISDNPMANSVQRLAHDLATALDNDAVSLACLDAMTKELSDAALCQRADRFAGAHSGDAKDENPLDNWPGHGATDFDEFRQLVERHAVGVVFTGHPTFAISRTIRQDFTDYVDAVHKGKPTAKLSADRHRPDEELTLQNEHDDARAAIANANDVVDALNGKILDVAHSRFPKQWHQLIPQSFSVATWVGYDLDGRTDIHWAQTLTIRLTEKAQQLAYYAQALETLAEKDGGPILQKLADQLSRASKLTAAQAALFFGDLNDPQVITKAANKLTDLNADKLISLVPIIALLSDYIDANPQGGSVRELSILRARMKSCGLGLARIHLRVNAAQVRSVLRHDFGVKDDTDFMGRSTLELAAQQASEADHLQINFAGVFLEQMTARRQFMLCAQILKHIDADTPIRFLIAECEAPATIMGAVYLARAYGVADKLDISPLFETPSAMERGGRFLEQLLKEKPFLDYIHQRKRICIQLGFSDSGRFMGQVPADLAIERVQILLARAMYEAGVTDIEALVFNTNGESMGRGTPPGTLEQRLHHLMTPWARARFARHAIKTNVESSFQGGEGFLHFNSAAIAAKTINRIFAISSRPHAMERGDAFYDDINFSWDLYRAVKSWQEDLFQNRDYTSAIATFAHRFLFSTGSRKTRRQKNGIVDMSPSALRAIPHNAILQQLAIPVNVAGGIGSSVKQEADRFVTYVKGSARMSGLIEYAARARDLTSLPAFIAYANIYNASYWMRRATKTTKLQTRASCETIAHRVADQKIFTALSRLGNHLAIDLAEFDGVLEALYGSDRATVRREDRIDLHVLHAVRQALIMHALILVARLPAFSGRHEVSHGELMDLALGLQFDQVTELIDQIFPVIRSEVKALSGICEPGSVSVETESGYPEVQREVREPIVEIDRLCREIGVGISHYYGAYG